jgi:hypothetical protein
MICYIVCTFLCSDWYYLGIDGTFGVAAVSFRLLFISSQKSFHLPGGSQYGKTHNIFVNYKNFCIQLFCFVNATMYGLAALLMYRIRLGASAGSGVTTPAPGASGPVTMGDAMDRGSIQPGNPGAMHPGI